MKTVILSLLVLISITACDSSTTNVPTLNHIYPQDIDQCVTQPKLIWCVSACNRDNSQKWCAK